ncbi:MAG: MgtC/SapB family protein [Clostridiales bacterium]|nr:MgtC/SapB family protein [Clostridiales bacterium]
MEGLFEFEKYISELNGVSITIRLFLAVLCGGLIGLERGRKGQAAGCRTHMLVCIGSALVMMTNIYVVDVYSPSSDPTRIGAQVVSGIGFLGAGSILVTSKNQIRGLTTAAGLWASACMGLAIGVGFYELAIIGNIFIFAVIAVVNKFDRKVYGKSRMVEIYVEFEDSHVLKRIIEFCRDNSIQIVNIQVVKNKAIEKIRTGAILTLKCKEKREHSELIAELSEVKDLQFIEEL